MDFWVALGGKSGLYFSFAKVGGGMPNPGENVDLFYRSLELKQFALIQWLDFTSFCWIFS